MIKNRVDTIHNIDRQIEIKHKKINNSIKKFVQHGKQYISQITFVFGHPVQLCN